jgi:hypothetical protein
LAWARVNQPTGDPIDETNLDSLFFAYDLTRTTFSPDEMKLVETWLRKIAEVEIANRNPKSSTGINNWNSHRLKIVGLIGFLLPDQKLIDYVVNGYKQQIADDLNPDGSSFDYKERDALHYHVYTLEPLLVLARAAQMNGIDLYSYQAPSGASLPKSIAFVIPFIEGTQTHMEFVNSTVKFDRDRAAAGEGEYAAHSWDPKAGNGMLWLNYFFDAKMVPLYIKVNASKATKYPGYNFVILDAQK